MAYNFDLNEKHQLIARITFAVWEYRLTVDRPMSRKEGGLDWVSWMLEEFYNEVDGSITLTNDAGETLLCEDDDDVGEDWLERMVVSASLVMPDAEAN